MLQIKEISKKYVTGNLTQVALDNVSLNLRDNEFVAILGPSGSGKTTLLNVIGGLDRYDSGDLIINGISTKKYTDRDWDSYRNHTIGFVFQSYNLIPHQNVLSNVELALTISGISKSERKKRAIAALEEVGLGDQLHKKPNQMSGGQMQRVAIARALVNNPDILLADEPTGALDTKTSVQIMDLLKKVAKDRLVVMVTHNPELAHEYATRIVELKDGCIISDSDPFEPSDQTEAKHMNMGHSSMSFLTSLALSFNNLKTKKGRTILTSFAGSIGIIGIALIMALSNGVNTYINSIQEDTLSEYPLTITRSGVDFSSFMGGDSSGSISAKEGDVREIQTISSLFATTNSNDLKSLKQYLDSDKTDIRDYTTNIEYSYNITPNIFRMVGDDDYRKVNPDTTFSNVSSNTSQITMMMSYLTQTSSFSAMPENSEMFKKQYEVMAGHWPDNHNECVVVLTENGTLTDLTLYTLGLKDITTLEKLLEDYAREKDTNFDEEPESFAYEDLIGIGFKVVDVSSYYEYDKEYKMYVDKSKDKKRMLDIVRKGEDLKVVGVVKPVDDTTASMLGSGISYPAELDKFVMDRAKDSEIVKKQLDNKEIDVFTGKKFGDKDTKVDLSKIFSLNEDTISDKLNLDDSLLGFDPSSFADMDLSGLSLDGVDMSALSGLTDMSDLGNLNLQDLFKNVSVDVSEENLAKLFTSVVEGYMEQAKSDPSTDYTKLSDSMEEFLKTEEAIGIITSHMQVILEDVYVIIPTADDLTALLSDVMSGFTQYITDKGIDQISDVDDALNEYLSSEEVNSKLNAFIENIRTQLDGVEINEEEISAMSAELYTAYDKYAQDNKLPQPSKFAESFSDYMSSENGQKVLFDGINSVVDLDDLSDQIGKALMGSTTDMSASFESVLSAVMSSVGQSMTDSISSMFSSITGGMSTSMADAFKFDEDTLKDMVNVGTDSDSLKELLNSFSNMKASSYEDNLSTLNYALEDNPYSISIYPKDFENKEKVKEILDGYNEYMKATNQEEKVITYSDSVATLMSSVTTIVDIVSYVLIAFVAISLIVSSIMIGIITYISVLERTKEIGILRAIGASKRNITQVFNAETFIIGFLAGIIGIGLSLLLIILANIILHAALTPMVSAILPVPGAVLLVILSVILTSIGGFIPSKKAARKDPVTALRTE